MIFLLTHWKAILFGIIVVGSFGAGWKFNAALEAEARAKLAEAYELELDKEEERRALIAMEYEEKLKNRRRTQPQWLIYFDFEHSLKTV